MKHHRAIALIEQTIRVYDANSRLHDMEAGEKAREAAAIVELRETVRVLEECDAPEQEGPKQ